jgi:hypothetical protein
MAKGGTKIVAAKKTSNPIKKGRSFGSSKMGGYCKK